MSCVTAIVRSVFFVRWQTPESWDLIRIQSDLTNAHITQGKKLQYIAIVPESADPPSQQVREAMMKSMDQILERCESVHFVMEGTGFRHGMLRSALAGILLVAGKRGRVFVHKSLDEALHPVAAAVGMDVESLRRGAKAAGIIESDTAAL